MMAGHKQGFTLIEVALAVAIVAIGVLAAYSLLSIGMDAGTRAVSETHAATFASGVFGALRARSLQAAELQPTTIGNWEQFWENFSNRTVAVPVAASNVWTGGSERWILAGVIRTSSCENLPYHAPAETGIVDHVLRYRVDVGLTYSRAQVLADLSRIGRNRATVALYVWDGKFGGAVDSNALLFYSEFNNPGDL